MREYEEIQNTKNSYWTAAPVNLEDPFEWHFTVRGPVDTEFENGIYHGRLFLPQNYPLSAPSISLLHPNGRFEVGKKVCMSASPYHPELWQPAWGLRTMFDALHVFFATPAGGAIRKKLATESVDWLCPICGKSNSELVRLHCAEPEPKAPTLPSVMVPATISSSCRYLRGAEHSQEDSPSQYSSQQPVRSPTNIDDNLQHRKDARRAVANAQSSQSVVSVLFQVLLQPISQYYHTFATAPSEDKLLHVLDIALLVMVFVTCIMVGNLVCRPGRLMQAFLLDGIV